MMSNRDGSRQLILAAVQKCSRNTPKEGCSSDKTLFDDALKLLTDLSSDKEEAFNNVIEIYHPMFPELLELLPDPIGYVKIAGCIKDNYKMDHFIQQRIEEIVDSTLDDLNPKMKTITCANIVARITRAVNNRRRETADGEVNPSTDLEGVIEKAILVSDTIIEIEDFLHVRIPLYHPSVCNILGQRSTAQFLQLKLSESFTDLTPETFSKNYPTILENCPMYEEEARTSVLTGSWDRQGTLLKIAKLVLRAASEKRGRDDDGALEKDHQVKAMKIADRELGISDQDFKKLRSKWTPRNKLIKGRQSVDSTIKLSSMIHGRIVRVTTSSTTYDVAMVERWVTEKSIPTSGQQIAVNFGSKTITIPVSKISNSLFTPKEVTAAFLQYYSLNDSPLVVDEGDEFIPAVYTSNVIKLAKPTTPKESNPIPYPRGMLVHAARLVAAPELNGKRARVSGTKNDRVVVYFLDSKKEKALKAINIDPVPPEEDPLCFNKFLPKERDPYYV